ncbi:MAG: 50S ribosomal protein L17 [Sporolactobacillus sp.]|jgi:large subunit ribosomal protein L17|nr:50S ribosomal protein L17 [Sporolactobacillus sp.]MCI1881323.1 50S ribosomal protein L17 [Sporolactobacillus sp.]
MSYVKLGRDSAARKALLRDLATDLIINERITTTHPKAKALRPIIEKMITLGKRGDLHARRQAAAFIRREPADEDGKQDAIQKLFDDIAKRYDDRQGGYTRVLKLGPRRGDGAELAIIELVNKAE